MRPQGRKLLAIDRQVWSGGGQNLMNNVRLAERLFPSYFSGSGTPLALSNVVGKSVLRQGGFIYLPQNAWAWNGPTVGAREAFRRSVIRAGSIAAEHRSLLSIRIGPMIPELLNARSQVLANVLDAEFEGALERGSNERKMSWIPDSRYWLVPGSLWSYRNVEPVIEAFKTAREFDPELCVLFVGPLPRESGLQKEVLRGGFDSGVSFFTERVERHQMLRAIESAEVCILSSLVEASPVTMLEAAALGTRIAAWDNAAYRFLAQDANVPDVDFFANVDELLTAVLAPRLHRRSVLVQESVRTAVRNTWVENFLSLCCDDLAGTEKVRST